MTKQGPRRMAADGEWTGRLTQAREVLGNALPDSHEKFFRRLLGRKDEVNYGARSTSIDEAARLLAELDEFGA